MLPASWALRRSSRAFLGHNRRLTLPFLSGIRYSSTANLHQAQNRTEWDRPPPTTSEFPIDVLNAQSTLRHLTELIEEGKEFEARNALDDFLVSSPEDGRLEAFRRLRHVLLKAPKENLQLIMDLGTGFSAMGYTELVKEQITPIVRLHGSSELYSHFELGIQLTGSSSSTSAPKEPEEYSSTFKDDLPSVFEEEGEEYYVHESIGSAYQHSSIQTAGVLLKMVGDGYYDQAYTLLKEMEDLGSSIPLSQAFELPANAVLDDPRISLEHKVDSFCSWFKYIPPAHLVPATFNFAETRRLILQSPSIHVPLLTRFALILARKGYADDMSTHIVPQVVRCTTKEVGLAFLEDFLKANVDYLLEYNIQNPIYRMKKTSTNVQGNAVRALCYSGRVEEAIAALPDPDNPAFKLTTYTYNVVLRRLRASPPELRDKYTEFVKGLRDQDLTAVPLPRSNQDSLRALSQEYDLAGRMDTAGPLDFGKDLVKMLRYLKKNIVTEEKADLPHPFTLVNFMSLYLSTGRTRALKMLLDKALKESFVAASNFVFAEMLFYRRLEQPNLVIQTFVDHFFLSGVPREETLLRSARISSQQHNYDPSSGEERPLKRFYPFDPSFTLPKGKIWPGRIHCNLVWDALADLTTQSKELEILYYKLVRYAEEGKDIFEPSIVNIPDQVPIPSNWGSAVGAAAFTPFVYRLMYSRGSEFGVRIIRDMLQLGIKPTVYHYTELAGFYARKGDVRRVFLILDGMERGAQAPFVDEASDARKRGLRQPIKEHMLPEPTLVTYVSLIRGFLIGKNLQAAEEVVRRLLRVHDYVQGDNRLLDAAMSDLEMFRQEGDKFDYAKTSSSMASRM